MTIVRRALFLMSVAAPCGWGAIFASHVNPATKHIERVCVMPVEADLKRIGVKGGEVLTKESEAWAAKLRDTLKNVVTGSGAQVIGDLSPDALDADGDLRQTVVRVQKKYDNISVQLNKKPNGVKKGRFSLGDEVLLLPCAAKADSLVFLHAQGLIQTGGRKTITIIAGGLTGPLLAQTRYAISVAFADSSTGEVQALIQASAFGGKMASDPEEALGKALLQDISTRVPIGRFLTSSAGNRTQANASH